MTHRSIALLVIALAATLPAAGCATSPGGMNEAAAAIPSTPSPLRGTWRGSAYDVANGGSRYSSRSDLRINDDGTWRLTESLPGGSVVESTGTSTARGNQVILRDRNGRRSLILTQSGDTLYGWERAMPGMEGPVKIEFTRSPE
jgi:hypothetical protein